jgi:hypothetical protein
MTTTENPAREEYFDQLENIFADYFCESGVEERKLKEKALSITYDPNVALQKRVEELEAALSACVREMDKAVYFDADTAPFDKAKELLTKQP